MAQFLDMVVKTVRACDDSDGGNARKRLKKDEVIRRDDNSGVLLLRLLHDVKFFLPTLLAKFPDKATRDKKQLEVVTYFVDECLRQNSQRGRQGREPLGYEEALRVAKSSLHNIYSGSGVGLVGDYDSDACSFDPYTSGSDGQPGSDSLSRGKRSKKSGGSGSGAGGSGTGSGGSGSGSGGSGSGSGGGPLPCRDWNGGVCNWSPCKFKHFCNKIVQGGGFCKALHKAKDHK